MANPLEFAATSSPAEESCPALANPAVAHCCDAYERARQEAEASGEHGIFAFRIAALAYRRAMPVLSGLANIPGFIACTTHGILIGAIDGSDGARLLYAVQVARGAFHSQPEMKKTAAA